MALFFVSNFFYVEGRYNLFFLDFSSKQGVSTTSFNDFGQE
jgi:hypothetical protein